MCKMKNVFQKVAAAIMAIIILATAMGAIPTMTAQAASPKIDKKLYFRLYKDFRGPEYVSVRYSGDLTNKKITKLKNSNPSVAKVSVYNRMFLQLQLKKVGTTNISFYFAGKKLTTKFIVKKWVNPCKEFKIGNEDYAKIFEESERYYLGDQKKTINAKVKITPKKGWKLMKIVSQTANGSKEKKVKNNSKVKFPIKQTGTAIYAHFKNMKTGQWENVALWRSDRQFGGNYCYLRMRNNEKRKRSEW